MAELLWGDWAVDERPEDGAPQAAAKAVDLLGGHSGSAGASGLEGRADEKALAAM